MYLKKLGNSFPAGNPFNRLWALKKKKRE